MNRQTPRLQIILLALPLCLIGGCPGLNIELPDGMSIQLPGTRLITLELINDTNYYVNPRILFDDDSNFLAAWFPSEELATGDLAPGEVLIYDFDCDELGLVLSDEAVQFVGSFDYVAYASRTFHRGEDYDCGDLIQFQFIGDAEAFGVVVAINGFVVD